MDTHNLVRMANQIGQFFESYPDPDQARVSIAEHIGKFWAPRMRRAIVAHVEAQGDASGLTPAVADAVRMLADPSVT